MERDIEREEQRGKGANSLPINPFLRDCWCITFSHGLMVGDVYPFFRVSVTDIAKRKHNK